MEESESFRVAVVIPCYNDGATLPEALASIDEPEPVEVVVVDDGSDHPGTLETFTRLEAQGVRIIHQPNRGLAAARMTGARSTTARYVTSLDADDRSAKGALSALADALDSDPRVAVAWGNIQTFGEKRIRERLGCTLDPWLITYVNTLPASALIRREALLAVGGWQLQGGYEDWDLWMALAERGFLGVHLPIVTNYYRVRSTRMLARAQSRHEELYRGLARRHADLFAARRRNRPRSQAPWRCKLLLPLLDRLPVSVGTRHRLFGLVFRPTAAVRVRLERVLDARVS